MQKIKSILFEYFLYLGNRFMSRRTLVVMRIALFPILSPVYKLKLVDSGKNDQFQAIIIVIVILKMPSFSV